MREPDAGAAREARETGDARAPIPQQALVAFATFVRQRLAEVGDIVAPLWQRRESTEIVVAEHPEHGRSAAHQLAMVIIGAAAPFAPTSHARARLLRQAHASGLLSAHETEQAQRAIGA